ncbi:hypothetical protein ACH4E7_43570 [Kitasatospora sp. NPDC018058]|uniref:hypothetical protein n=1 Tax=Kitasatospora sp. NPDC018058 TaxID=3364025 RepID=UPI0037C1A5E0
MGMQGDRRADRVVVVPDSCRHQAIVPANSATSRPTIQVSVVRALRHSVGWKAGCLLWLWGAAQEISGGYFGRTSRGGIFKY